MPSSWRKIHGCRISMPVSIVNGAVPVDPCIDELYAICMAGNNSDQLSRFSLTNALREVTRIWFVASAWPFACGWYAVVNERLTPNVSVTCCQNVRDHRVSRSDIT